MKRLLVSLVLLAAVPALAPTKQLTWITQAEFKCLADNVYHESRNQPLRGQLAVARVTLNRATHKDVCKVVYEKHQFSWTATPKRIKDKEAYKIAKWVAYHSIGYNFPATYFHHTSIKPVWAKHLTKLETIGQHVFYEDQTLLRPTSRI